MPGQTIVDVMRAEARFLEEVQRAASRGARASPCVIGNCQAGWAMMMLAAVQPELIGPRSCSPARRCPTGRACAGQNPMRYIGGLLGGAWLAALAGDLGNGRFDGANLVRTSRALNPANTWWTKYYNSVRQGRHRGRRASWSSRRWWGGYLPA